MGDDLMARQATSSAEAVPPLLGVDKPHPPGATSSDSRMSSDSDDEITAAQIVKLGVSRISVMPPKRVNATDAAVDGIQEQTQDATMHTPNNNSNSNSHNVNLNNHNSNHNNSNNNNNGSSSDHNATQPTTAGPAGPTAVDNARTESSSATDFGSLSQEQSVTGQGRLDRDQDDEEGPVRIDEPLAAEPPPEQPPVLAVVSMLQQTHLGPDDSSKTAPQQTSTTTAPAAQVQGSLSKQKTQHQQHHRISKLDNTNANAFDSHENHLDLEAGDDLPKASYTSPDHEWARILQRRLGKGLSDAQAQTLARSNSMLASPSILAQSLTKVIPHLQSKDVVADASLAQREHQTPEELFDRPLPIEPSTHDSLREREQQRDADQCFPSSTFNQKNDNLLLFQPLNPDQLFGKSAKSSTAVTGQSISRKQQPSSSSSLQQPQKDAPVTTTSTLVNNNTTTTTTTAAVATASSVPAPTHASAPSSATQPGPQPGTQPGPSTANHTQDPSLLLRSNDLSKIMSRTSPSAALSHPDPNSSLPATATLAPVLSVTPESLFAQHSQPPLMQHPNPIAPIQYTPLTQYKANPSKDTRKKLTADSPAKTRLNSSEPARPRANSQSSSQPKVDKAPMDSANWALEAMSGILADPAVDISALGAKPPIGPPVSSGSGSQHAHGNRPSSVLGGSFNSQIYGEPSPMPAKMIQSPFELDDGQPFLSVAPPVRPEFATLRNFSSDDNSSSPAIRSVLPTSLQPAAPVPGGEPYFTNEQHAPAHDHSSTQGIVPNLQSAGDLTGAIPTPSNAAAVTLVLAAATSSSGNGVGVGYHPPLQHTSVNWMGSSAQQLPMTDSQLYTFASSAFQQQSYPPALYSATQPTVLYHPQMAIPQQQQMQQQQQQQQQNRQNQSSRADHRSGGSVSSLREIAPHVAMPPVSDRSAAELQPPTTAPKRADLDVTTTTGYEVPWLPHSRPLIPPTADVNSIDVPALAGKQFLSTTPRSTLTSGSTPPSCKFNNLAEAIWFRAKHQGQSRAFAAVDSKGVEWGTWSWDHAFGKADLIARTLQEKTQLRSGARVALVYRLSEMLDFVAAFYGTILAGMVPVLVNQIQELSEMVYIMTLTKVEIALTTEHNNRALNKDKESGSRKSAVWPSNVAWWQTDKMSTKGVKARLDDSPPTVKMPELAYIEYTKSALGELKGVATSHQRLMGLCQTMFRSMAWSEHKLSPSSKRGNVQGKETAVPDTVMMWLEPRQSVGLFLGCIMGTYTGSFTLFLDSAITSHAVPWLQTATKYEATLAMGDYDGAQKMLNQYRNAPPPAGHKLNLKWLRSFYVDTQTSQPILHQEFLDGFLYPLGMIRRDEKQDPLEPSPPTSSTLKAVPSSGGSKSRDSGTGHSLFSRPEIGRSDHNLIAMLTLPEIGGMILGLRDTMGHPEGAERIDIRKKYRKSTSQLMATPGSGLATTGSLRMSPSATGSSATKATKIKLKNHPISSMAATHYLLDRPALRANKIVVLATGNDAVERADEVGTMLINAFGYPIAESTVLVVDPETLALTLPDQVGEIWISAPATAPVGYWGLPEHTQEVFHAKSYIVTTESMIASPYSFPGSDEMLRTGMYGAMIEGRIVCFGPVHARLQQDAADPKKQVGTEFAYHHVADLMQTLRRKVNGISELSIFQSHVNQEYAPVVCLELVKDQKINMIINNTTAQQVARNVCHVLLEICSLRTFAVAVWEGNSLPRLFKNGRRVVDHTLCKKAFELGRITRMIYLHTIANGVLCNIPQGDDGPAGFWTRDSFAKRHQRIGISGRYGQFSTNVLAMDVVDERTHQQMNRFHNVTDILMWRSIVQPDDLAFAELDHRGKESKSINYKKFNHRVTGYALHLDKKHGMKAGDHAVLWFGQDLEFVVALHACWALGVIPIPLPLPENYPQTPGAGGQSQASSNSGSQNALGSSLLSPGSGSFNLTSHQLTALTSTNSDVILKRGEVFTTLGRILDEVKVKYIIGSAQTEELMKQKSTANNIRAGRSQTGMSQEIPTFINITKAAKTSKSLGSLSGYAPRKEWLDPNYPAVVLVDWQAKPGTPAYKRMLKLSHDALTNLCRNQKVQSGVLLQGRSTVTCMSIFGGLGFVHGTIGGIYTGTPTYLMHPTDFQANPLIWLEALNRYKAMEATLTQQILEQLLQKLESLGSTQTALESRCLDNIKSFAICTDSRVHRDQVNLAIAKLAPYRLDPQSISTVYTHAFNPLIAYRMSLQATVAGLGHAPTRLHVSTQKLRLGIIHPTTEGDDPTGIWLEDTGCAATGTTIAIVHPESFEMCPFNHIGEIWIRADANVNSYYDPQNHHNDLKNPRPPFGVLPVGGDSRFRYVRTGDLGFLWNSPPPMLASHSMSHPNSGGSMPLFVLGSMSEAFQANGLLHFPIDIETTVEGSHANVIGCVCFKTLSDKVVCVIKIQNQEQNVLMSMYIPILYAILQQHQFMPDTLVLVGDGVSLGNHQTLHHHIPAGLKPRARVHENYVAGRLPVLHVHQCHGSLTMPPLQQPISHIQQQPLQSPTQQQQQPGMKLMGGPGGGSGSSGQLVSGSLILGPPSTVGMRSSTGGLNSTVGIGNGISGPGGVHGAPNQMMLPLMQPGSLTVNTTFPASANMIQTTSAGTMMPTTTVLSGVGTAGGAATVAGAVSSMDQNGRPITPLMISPVSVPFALLSGNMFGAHGAKS